MINASDTSWVMAILEDAMEAEKFGSINIKIDRGQIVMVEEAFTKRPPRLDVKPKGVRY